MKSIPVLRRPLLKTEQQVLTQIRKHTDKHGWGLEESEIIEYAKLSQNLVSRAIKGLASRGLINMKISAVANHIFFNDTEKWDLAHAG